MDKKQETNLNVSPETRLCPKFDPTAIAKFQVAKKSEMGIRVVDDCAEAHQM